MPSPSMSYSDWRTLIEETIVSQQLAVVEQSHACISGLILELVSHLHTWPAGVSLESSEIVEVEEGNLLQPSMLVLLRAADTTAVLTSDHRLAGLLSWSHWKCLLPLPAHEADYFVRKKVEKVLSPTALRELIRAGKRPVHSSKSPVALTWSLWKSNIQQLRTHRTGAAAIRWLIHFSDASLEKLVLSPKYRQELNGLVRVKQEELWRVISSGFNQLCFQIGNLMKPGGNENINTYSAKLLTEPGFRLSAEQLNLCNRWADEVLRFPLLSALGILVAPEYLMLLLSVADWRERLFMGCMAVLRGWKPEELAQAVATSNKPLILAEKDNFIQFSMDEGRVSISRNSSGPAGVFMEWELAPGKEYKTAALHLPTVAVLRFFGFD